MTRNEQTPAPATYDSDFFVWTQQQAAALRLTRDLIGDSVDVEHVAEELEDMGKRDLREVGSFLSRLIEHLLKLNACPASRDRPHWMSEAGHFHSSAIDAFTPGMRQSLRLEKIWQRGCRDALLSLEEMDVVLSPPARCPFNLDQLFTLTTAARDTQHP